MSRGRGCKNASNSDAGGSQDGGGGAPPPASPSSPQSPVSVVSSSSTQDEGVPDLWDGGDDSSADCTEEDLEDNRDIIMTLVAEVDQGNYVIMQKIKLLSKKYKYFRPIQRDGNCFYRAFMFSYLEHILQIEDDSERNSEVTHLRLCVEKAKHAYGNLLSPLLYKESSLQVFDAFEFVFNLIEAGLSPGELYGLDKDVDIIEDILPSVRMLTEIELRTQEEFYSPFLSSLEGYESIHEFCRYEVRPMHTEANHWQITALVNALGVPLIVENLDTSMSYGVIEVNRLTFCPRCREVNQVFANFTEETEERTVADLSPVERRRLVALLYRPGHYDILYPK